MRGQYKNKRDANEPQIFDTLRAYGISVYPLNQPLDALCGFGGKTYLVEVKNGPKASLTPPQEKFLSKWNGQHVVLASVDEAEQWAKQVRAGE